MIVNKVLDKGYIRHIDTYGNDLMVVNNARASYSVESYELNEKDERLIKFLAREKHMTPFRSPRLSFEIKAPLFVARQWWRYVVDTLHIEDGTSWNEASRRYIRDKVEFYVPASNEWRSAPANSKQGSGDNLPLLEGINLTEDLLNHYARCEDEYNKAIDKGVAPEQARLFLPAYGLYVTWRYTTSLESVCHMIKQRTAKDAQYEFQEYAKVIKDIVLREFPISGRELLK